MKMLLRRTNGALHAASHIYTTVPTVNMNIIAWQPRGVWKVPWRLVILSPRGSSHLSTSLASASQHIHFHDISFTPSARQTCIHCSICCHLQESATPSNAGNMTFEIKVAPKVHLHSLASFVTVRKLRLEVVFVRFVSQCRCGVSLLASEVCTKSSEPP